MNLTPDTPFGSAFGTATPFFDFDAKFLTVEERSDLGCILINSAVDTKDVAHTVSATLGYELPTGSAVTTAANTVGIWLTPRSWLVRCPVSDEFALLARINESFPDKRVHATAFTDYLAWLDIRGKEAHKLLTSGGFLSFEIEGLSIGHAKRTIFASIPVVVVRKAEEHWTIGVERSRGTYLMEFLRDTEKRERGIALDATT